MHLSPGTTRAKEFWERIVSLIATAKINGVEIFAWLKATMEAVAAGHPQATADDLLP